VKGVNNKIKVNELCGVAAQVLMAL